MLRRTLFCTGAMFSLGAGVATADTSLVSTGSVTSGYSSNILGVAENDPNRPVVGDGFMDLTPGLAVAYEMPRHVHSLTYTFGARLFLNNMDDASFTNTVAYQSLVAVSARSTMRVTASLNSGRVNQFEPEASAIVPGDTLPNGDVEFVSYTTTGLYRYLINPVWTAQVSLGSNTFEPTGSAVTQQASNYGFDQGFRLERTFRYHLLGAETRLALNTRTGVLKERTITLGPGIFWTWNISESISTNASAGLDVLREVPNSDRGLVVPRGAASATYSHERGQATAGWNRAVAANIFGGANTVTNQYFLNLALPAPTRRPIVVTTTGSYARGDVFDIALDQARGRTERLSADVVVGTQINRAWQIAARAQVSRQIRNDDMVVDGRDLITRESTVALVLSGRFPESAAGQVPQQSSRRVESGNADFARQESAAEGR